MKRATINGKKMTSKQAAHEYIAGKLKFPEYYGKNLDALADCLTDIGEPKLIRLTHIEEMRENLGDYANGFIKVFSESAQRNKNIKLKIEE